MQKNSSEKTDAPSSKAPLGHCSNHGLKYPAAGTCPLCLHGLSTEMERTATTSRRAFGGVVGLAIVGLLLALTPSSWIEKGLRVAVPVHAFQPQNADLELNPAAYGQEIALLEAILNQPGKPQYFEAERIALFVEQLASAIAAREETASAQLAQKRLRAFAERVQQNLIQRGDAGLDLQAVRQDWQKLRPRIFAATNPATPPPLPTETKPADAHSKIKTSKP